MAPKKKEKSDHDADWQYCEGKRLLLEDIRNGRYPESMDWKVIFEQRPEFNVGESYEEAKRLFQNRLKAARDRIKQDDQRTATELEMLRQDRVNHPPSAYTSNHTREPRWEGSAAQALLKKDLAEKKHETMARGAFYASRPEYQQFQKRTFSKHIDEEVRLVKFLKDYGSRRKNKKN